ncbi:hypothetical protein [Phaeobacter porticola]|nr:hypothetical protein [Phaeobacter porticola]
MTQSIIEMQKGSASVEPFPIRQSVKGILRRAVQLLKRHRDQHFLEIAEEVAPISMIITTLGPFCTNRLRDSLRESSVIAETA